MKHDFWHQKWAEGKIGFHQGGINPYLKSYWQRLNLEGEETVFVPLCGKSLDMLWLRDQGHSVTGVELNASACKSFFQENEIQPESEQFDSFRALTADRVQLLCGDFFALTPRHLDNVAAVYDRAALIALPPEMRQRYASQLIDILPFGVKMLLVTLEFEGADGPPFSVAAAEVNTLFKKAFAIECLDRVQPDDPRDVGRTEVTWLLTDTRI